MQSVLKITALQSCLGEHFG